LPQLRGCMLTTLPLAGSPPPWQYVL
jgi:hypothetical protein